MPDDDESLPVLELAPDDPPIEPDELPEPELPPVDEEPMAPDEPEDEPVVDMPDEPVLPLDEPVVDMPEEPVEPLSEEPVEPVDDEPVDEEPSEPDEPDAPLEPMLAPLVPVAGLALEDELPLRLPDEPALADEPMLLLPRLEVDLSSLPMLLPMPCLLASTPFPSLDF